MTATQPDSPRLTRRGLLRTTAGALGAAAGVGALGSTARPAAAIDWGSVGKTAVLAAASPPVAFGWALREFEIIGSDPPPEGLTPDALHQSIYDTARTRLSTNKSTIVDNRNILDGVEHNAYIEAKTAAIEALNADKSQSDVQDAAIAAIDDYQTTIETNLLSSWNEAVNEAHTMVGQVEAMSDLNVGDVIQPIKSVDHLESYTFSLPLDNTTRTMPDGTSFPVHEFKLHVEWYKDDVYYGNFDITGSPLRVDLATGGRNGAMNPESVTGVQVTDPDGNGDVQKWLFFRKWNSLYDELTTKFTNVRDGIILWVDKVTSQVEEGEIEVSELITPRERAAMLPEEESQAQAIADLTALNIPIDPEREVTVTITETGATLSGTIGLTDESDGPIESGTTYDPSTFAGDVYLTADVSQLSGAWDAYETGVDGGTITLTAQPYEGTVLNVTTTAGETVSVPASDWTDNGDGTYSYDASGDLETNITEVESVEYESAATETQYETLNLSREFTVESIVNRETGENTSTASFESNEPQTDSNYITQKEWNQLEEQNQELIEKYEESQSSGGAGAGFFDGSSPDIGLIAAVGGGAGVVYALFGQGDN